MLERFSRSSYLLIVSFPHHPQSRATQSRTRALDPETTPSRREKHTGKRNAGTEATATAANARHEKVAAFFLKFKARVDTILLCGQLWSLETTNNGGIPRAMLSQPENSVEIGYEPPRFSRTPEEHPSRQLCSRLQKTAESIRYDTSNIYSAVNVNTIGHEGHPSPSSR